MRKIHWEEILIAVIFLSMVFAGLMQLYCAEGWRKLGALIFFYFAYNCTEKENSNVS